MINWFITKTDIELCKFYFYDFTVGLYLTFILHKYGIINNNSDLQV